jgi:hypothetical protein
MKKEFEFQKQVADLLRTNGIQFEEEAAIGGVKPDILIHGPNNRLIVVDTKTWDPKPGFTVGAVDQARLYQEVLGADSAFMVLDKLKRNNPSEGVINIAGLMPAIEDAFSKPRKKKSKKKITSAKSTVFAAMPFSSEYNDTFFVAMAYAAEKIGAACIRVDHQDFEGDIITEIKRLIKDSIAAIIDFSESKPNVLYEAGYAHASGIPTVHICSTPLNDLPFDVRNTTTMAYKKGDTHSLRKKLAKRLKAVLKS